MVNVPSLRKPKKGKGSSWDLKGEYLRSRSSKGNSSTFRSKVTNPRIVDYKRGKKPKKANVVDGITKDVSDIDLKVVIFELNLVRSNPKEWWVDTGATHHVCSDKKMFSTFEQTEIGEKVYMGNSATSEIKGQGKVVLKMTYGKEVTLKNVLYVLEICKNLFLVYY